MERFGKWITNGTDRPFYARRSFDIRKPVQKAVARVSGLGQFNFYLNGEKVSDHILDPGWTDYRKAVQYVEFDVTEMLVSGANGVGIEVGNGWYLMDDYHYTFHFPPFMPPNPNPYRPFGPCLLASVCIDIFYADGTTEQILSDENFRTSLHAVERSNVYGSERICGAKKQEGFSRADFDDSSWERASLAGENEIPAGEMIPQSQPPVKVIRVYDGTKLGTVGGMDVYDLGQNISGQLGARVRGKAGTVVRFYPAEKLDESGVPDQMAKNWLPIDNVLTYVIAKDDVWEEVRQTFTYFGARYYGVMVSDGEAEVGELKGYAITSAWKEAGSFHCDDERYNRIYDMIEKTVEANMLSVHTDCPTIERFAWQEPNHLMGAAILFMKDGKALWEKFLADMRRAQHTAEDAFVDMEGKPYYPGDGLVPAQAPCYIPNVLPVPGMGDFYDIIPWGSALILGARWHYLFYGDLSVIEDNYDASLRYLAHLKTRINENGFLNYGLGDWGNPEGMLARDNIETAFLYADAATLSWFAGLLGKEEDAKELSAFAATVRDNYNEKLLVRGPGGKWCYRCYEKRDEGIVMTQACEALPLYWGMVPEEKTSDVAESFRRTLEEKGAFVAGEVGLPYVIQCAARHGMNDLIARFIVREEHPSYYAFLLDGETTLGEYWEKNPRSHCHDMMGHITEWFYSGIAGIEILEPGFKKVRIHPWMPESIHTFTCTHETPYGTIRVRGERRDGVPHFEVTGPELCQVMK